MLSSLYCLEAVCSCVHALKLISSLHRDQQWIFLKNTDFLDFPPYYVSQDTRIYKFHDIFMNTWCFHHFTASKLYVLVFMRLNWFPACTETKSGFSWRIQILLIFHHIMCLRTHNLQVSWYFHEYLMLSSLYCLEAVCSCFYALKLISSLHRDKQWIFLKTTDFLDFPPYYVYQDTRITSFMIFSWIPFFAIKRFYLA